MSAGALNRESDVETEAAQTPEVEGGTPEPRKNHQEPSNGKALFSQLAAVAQRRLPQPCVREGALGEGGGHGPRPSDSPLSPLPPLCNLRQTGGGEGLAGGGEGPPLVPLHVPDAPHRLDLGVLSPKISTVLVVPFFKQVLVASVAGVLVAYPPAKGREESLTHCPSPGSRCL